LLQSSANEYSFVFIHPRGLWDGALPDDLRATTVDHHAKDLAAIVEHLSLNRYGVIAHCAGVATAVAGFNYLQHRPERALFCSTRFSQGTPLEGLERIVERVLKDPRFCGQYAKVISAYAPPSLRRSLESELANAQKLAAQLYAVQSSREYVYADAWPGDVRVILAYATGDFEALRRSTDEYARKVGDRCMAVLELEGSHCVLQEDLIIGRRLIQDTFSGLI
jgi:pimeloyl-ACP methyl ester carboxylesterase